MTSSQIEKFETTEKFLKGGHKKCNESPFKLANLWVSRRYFIAFLLIWGYFNVFCLRMNMNIAIVEMTNDKTIIIGNRTITKAAEFNWDSVTKGLVLGVPSYGIGLSIIVGYFVNKLGGSTSFGIGLIIPAVLSVSSPSFLHLNFYLFLFGRFLEGSIEVFTYCSGPEIWTKWAPQEERSRLTSFSFTGVYIGMIVAFPFCGFLAHNWGWESIFYVTGGISMIWSLIWLASVGNDPSKDKWISKEELSFIMSKQKPAIRQMKGHCSLRRVLSSAPFWAFFICKFGYGLGYSLIITCLPLFIKDKTNMNIKNIGLISALPNIASLIAAPMVGFSSDYIQNKKYLTSTWVHKIFIGAAFLLCAPILFSVAAITNFNICLLLLITFQILLSVTHISAQSLPVYMAPQFPGIIQGYISMGHSLGICAGTLIIGFIVTDHSDTEWSICFITFGVVMIISALVFIVFGSSEVQPWNDQSKDGEGEQTTSELHL